MASSWFRQPSILPGFGLTLGFTTFFLSALVLLPLFPRPLLRGIAYAFAPWRADPPAMLADLRVAPGSVRVADGLHHYATSRDGTETLTIGCP